MNSRSNYLRCVPGRAPASPRGGHQYRPRHRPRRLTIPYRNAFRLRKLPAIACDHLAKGNPPEPLRDPAGWRVVRPPLRLSRIPPYLAQCVVSLVRLGSSRSPRQRADYLRLFPLPDERAPQAGHLLPTALALTDGCRRPEAAPKTISSLPSGRAIGACVQVDANE